MAQTNRVIAPEIDTIFLTTNLKYSYLSSSIVKEIAESDGDIARIFTSYGCRSGKKKLDEMKKAECTLGIFLYLILREDFCQLHPDLLRRTRCVR